MSALVIHSEGHIHGPGMADLIALDNGALTLGADGKVECRGGAMAPTLENDKSTAYTCAAVDPSGAILVLGDAAAFVKVDAHTGLRIYSV